MLCAGYLRFKTDYWKPFPIRCSLSRKPPKADEQTATVNFVDRILQAKWANPFADNSALERQIDQLVYRLYGLTDDEIKIVDGSS